ncbi:glycosyltransferase [Candidatus Sumerlaeota bacterium]|nr:glycosyltransferase [Candidatus Sumerlaeota bacterium]
MVSNVPSRDIFFWLRFILLSFRVFFRCALVYPISRLIAKKRKSDKNPDDLLVIFSQAPWRGVWQRPQEQAMGLSKYFRIVYISPLQPHEAMMHDKGWKRMESVASGKGVAVFSPLIFPGHYKSSLIFRINQWILAREMISLLRNELPVMFLTNSPFIEPALRSLPFSRLIYDVIDDFAAFDWAPPYAEKMEQNLLKKADIVFTGTYALYEQKKQHGKKPVYIPCGVDFKLFHEAKGEEPEDIRGLPRPLIGYMGTLSDRIDSSIINGLAARLKSGSIILIGPVHGSLVDPPRAPNIHYLGLKSHDILPAYLRHVKVALLPFRLTKGVRAINPVKTLEYLAAGCVVVSTAIPDVVRFYSDVVTIASSPEDFMEKTLELSARDNTDLIHKGVERARNFSWEEMIEKMNRMIREYLAHTPRTGFSSERGLECE